MMDSELIDGRFLFPRESTHILESPPPCYKSVENKGGNSRGELKIFHKNTTKFFRLRRASKSVENKGGTLGGTQGYGLMGIRDFPSGVLFSASA